MREILDAKAACFVCGFLLYLNQYDFSVDDTTVEASQSGENNFIDGKPFKAERYFGEYC